MGRPRAPRRCSICDQVGHDRSRCTDLRRVREDLDRVILAFEAPYSNLPEPRADWRVRHLRKLRAVLSGRIINGAR